MVSKLRLTDTDGNSRYALVVSRGGVVLSTTTNEERAGKFDENTQVAVSVHYANPKNNKRRDTFEFVG